MPSQRPSDVVAGAEGILLEPHARILYAHGGDRLLDETTQNALREHVEAHARAALPGPAPTLPRKALTTTLGGVGRAAAIGALVDTSIAAVQVGRAHHRGEITTHDALTHVGREAVSGAASAAAGAAAVALVVTLTGGVAAPLAFLIGVGTSVAARRGLHELWRRA